jgi:putative transposase
MVRYRRNFVPGATYFFTVTLEDRRSSLLTDQIPLLRAAFRLARTERPFAIDAIVVLLEHLHTIFTLPIDDADFSGRWRRIKSHFTLQVAKRGVAVERNHRSEYSLWQRRFWEHTIRDERDFERQVDYIHYNPVKHGLVNRVCDWPHSSFHQFVRRGVLSRDWAGVVNNSGKGFGERTG